ncbi:sodium-dependent bicarbonate transport family permease [Tautonia plasticadhaerens]
MVGEFWENFRHNLFKPLLLFFYAGFLIPLLGVKFEFPYVIYQGLTIYLLIAIGWHGGEELAMLDASSLGTAAGFMGVGFVTNLFIGVLAFGILRAATKLRRIDAATVAGYYGSDSAGTFVTCLGVLGSLHLAYAPYMPVMLAVMEIPGCLVALVLVSSLRKRGMDGDGNCPDEPGFTPGNGKASHDTAFEIQHQLDLADEEKMALERGYHEHEQQEEEHRLARGHAPGRPAPGKPPALLSKELLHEVFFNPGIYLLFAGILIGFISRMQGPDVTNPDDRVFLDLFPGLLCLFLLEMGMTASRKLKDLKVAGPAFIAFGLIAPNVFATIGISVAHAYSMALGQPFDIGTYALFAVLCGAASYIAVPAVQRLAIPEASPTLPLAASLGLTFSYNVTIGIPVYIEIAKLITRMLPVG